MEQFLYDLTGIPIYFLGFIPFSGYIGYYALENWHQKWGQNINERKGF